MSEEPTYQQLQQRIAELESEIADLRARQHTEGDEDLRLSLERFRLAFQTSPDAININRLTDGAYIDVNEGFTKLSGYTREEILGSDSIHVDIWENSADRARLVKGLRKKGYVENLEARFVVKDGTVKYGLLSARILNMNNEKVMLSITRDVTDIKIAQQKVAESESRLRALIENSPDIFFAHDVKGRIRVINDQACRSLGYSRQELMGMSILDLEAETSLEAAAAQWRKVANGEVISSEKQQKRKDGSTFPVEVKLASVKFNGVPLIFGFARDISERKAMERERERIQNRLILAQRLEAIGTLAGGVAHDFNNLMLGIQGRASMMSYDLDSSHPCFEHVEAILEHSLSATQLTKQLLGIARGGKYEVKPLDINAVLIESATIFGRTKKEIHIHSKLHEPPPVVQADHRQIEQVLLNLYVNAWQAMPEGGEIYLQTSVVNLEEDFCRAYSVEAGPFVRITVNDTGVGMDQETLVQIFDPFFTTKEKSRGTGLGLASTYGIVKNHGGIITAYSEKNRGTTFNIYLPVSDQPLEAKRPSPMGLTKGTGTILMVDDEEMILEVGTVMLKKLGYQVLAARGGQAAIDLLQKEKKEPDLVILDLIMPGMNGEKTFEAIRRRHPDIPVLLASGYTLDGQASQVMEKGCNGFIQKPFNLEELSQKVRSVISESVAARGASSAP